MPKLVVSLPDAGEVIHELTKSVISVGRVEDNLIQIADGSVSSHHAELNLEGATYLLSDLGSTNGTSHNGVPLIDPVLLSPGDRISFGSVIAIYEPEAKLAAPLQADRTPDAAISKGENIGRPENFVNASPFAQKKAKSDPLATVGTLLFVLAVLAAGAAGYFAFALEISPF